MTDLPSAIVGAVTSVAGEGPVDLHAPVFQGNELRYVSDCLESGLISSIGTYVNLFEEKLQEVTGASFVVATMNGTASLHVGLRVLGVAAGDEVVLPSLAFVAPANAVLYAGASPHFFDIESDSFGLDPEKLRKWMYATCVARASGCINRRTGRRIGAIVAVHVFGHPCRIDEICDIGREFGVPIVEDAAEALGSTYRGKALGTFGDVATLSFNGNKIVTTGGGGALLTATQGLADRARHLTTTAKIDHPWRYVHDEMGFNYRLPGLNAAVGVAQLERLHFFVKAKRQLFWRYMAAMTEVRGVSVLAEPREAFSNYWLQNILLDRTQSNQRDEVIMQLNAAGYGARPAWDLLPELPPFVNFPRQPLDLAQEWVKRIVSLPSGVGI